MTLAKIVVTGKVVKTPEKRFTQNNLAITSLILDIYPQDETLIRVTTVGNQAERVADCLAMGDTVIVDGRLQMETVKTAGGKERKVATINASSIEKILGTETLSASADSAAKQYSAPASASGQQQKEPVVQFSTDEIAEDLIDPEEIPF